MNAKFSLMVLIVLTLIDIGMIFCILHVAGRENFILAGFAISILMVGIISVAWNVGARHERERLVREEMQREMRRNPL